jgi:MoaA/NifB/PqqE/SkfB family radical SAM enzyme
MAARLPYVLRYGGQGLRSLLAGRAPLFPTVFVTARCGLACGHCLYASARRASDPASELTLEEYRRIASRIPRFPKLLLTGGEPLLRDDLAGIAAAFHDLAGVRQITLATAAQHPDRAVRFVEGLLAGRPDLVLELQCSLDGVGPAHDRIRGPGAFDRLRATVAALSGLEAHFPGLEVRYNFTFSRATQEAFPEVLAYVSSEGRRLDLVLVRPPTADPAWVTGVDLDLYRAAADRLQELERQRAGRSPLRRALAERVRVERSIVAHHHEGRRVLDRCLAGTLVGVVSETGDVHPCEMLDVSFGNLRDVDYDLGTLWTGEAARAHRRLVRDTRCFCTFETGVRTSATFRPRTFVEMATGWMTSAAPGAGGGRR